MLWREAAGQSVVQKVLNANAADRNRGVAEVAVGCDGDAHSNRQSIQHPRAAVLAVTSDCFPVQNREAVVMRARNIKPGFFKNDILAECSFAARLLFAGLWTLADRAGRLEDRPKRIKGELFAFDNVDIEALITELSDRNFVQRYEIDGVKCIEIPAFAKHQNPHCKEAASILPAPSTATSPVKGAAWNETSTGPAQCEQDASTVQVQEQHSSSPADSLLLIPDSPIPDSLSPGKPGKGSKTLPPIPESLDTPGFRSAWEEWQTHKREKRKPVKPTATKRLFAKWAKWGPERAAAAIVHSIEHDWLSVHEEERFDRKPAGAGTEAALKSFVGNGVHA